jgi:type III pantothenate kinase
MRLLIDAGNTRIKWTLAADEDLGPVGNLPNNQGSELAQCLAHLPEVQQVWVSNVAGERVAQQIRAACAVRGWPLQLITAQAAQCGVSNAYAQPGQLGSDRWAALIAAWHLLGRAALVVNCGTATTIDALSAQGMFLGGLILPGVELMQRSVIGATAQLQPADAEYAAFPKNTADAMYSGAVQASCGAIQRQHVLLAEGDAPVLLSGGAAAHMEGRAGLPMLRVDNLVLKGIWLISQEAGK